MYRAPLYYPVVSNYPMRMRSPIPSALAGMARPGSPALRPPSPSLWAPNRSFPRFYNSPPSPVISPAWPAWSRPRSPLWYEPLLPLLRDPWSRFQPRPEIPLRKSYLSPVKRRYVWSSHPLRRAGASGVLE